MSDSVGSMVYSGEFRHAMDDKNRVTVPAAWRLRADGETFYTIAHQSGKYVVVMPPGEFERTGDVVASNPAISPADRRVFIRQFYSRARQCVTDRQGRMLIPDEQRKAVGLGSEVVLVGGRTRFEIWPPDRWDEVAGNESPTFEQVSNLIGL